MTCTIGNENHVFLERCINGVQIWFNESKIGIEHDGEDWSLATPLELSAFSQAERKYTALAIDIRSEVRAAYAQMKVARRRAAFYRHRVLPLQEEALKQTQLQFNGMIIPNQRWKW